MEVRRHQDRADRAEKWLYQISVEIEQSSLEETIAVSRSHLLHKQFPARSDRLFQSSSDFAERRSGRS